MSVEKKNLFQVKLVECRQTQCNDSKDSKPDNHQLEIQLACERHIHGEIQIPSEILRIKRPILQLYQLLGAIDGEVIGK